MRERSKQMKRFISLAIIVALLMQMIVLSTFALEPSRIDEQCHTHSSCRAVAGITRAAACPQCGVSAYVTKCAADYQGFERLSHTRITGTCNYILYYSHILYMCNSCGYWTLSSDLHWCDEQHECSLGFYPTCTVSYA